MIDVLEAMETLICALEAHGGPHDLGTRQRIRAEIRHAIERSGSQLPAATVCQAIETGDVEVCRASGITLGGLVVWRVALCGKADSVSAAVSNACDAGVGYLFALPENVYRRAGVNDDCRRAVLLKLEAAVQHAINEAEPEGAESGFSTHDRCRGHWSP